MNGDKKKLLEKILRFMAFVVLKKYHPIIVGITGSVGKSSTKEAIALVVSRAYSVRKAEGNYNNEIGVPLTIIGAKSGGSSLFAWVKVLFAWLSLVIFPVKYPEVLILEMGIDRPGDMEYLLSFVSVNIGVVTQISSSHIAFFGSLGNIAKEKGKLLAALSGDGFAVLNFDDKRVIKMQEKTKAKTFTYGFGEGAMLHIDNLLFHRDVKRTEGFSFKLNYAGKTIPVRLPKIVARHHIGSVLAGVAVGIALKMNLVEIAETLENFEPLPGRLRLLSGKNGMSLLDDTYNASPSSAEAALETLKEFMAPRKVVILGDMLELGADAKESHRALGEKVIASGAHIVIAVGEHMQSLYDALLLSGFSSRQVYWFPDVFAALGSVQDIVRSEDLILIKGSRAMRMEKITEALLADANDVETMLCCQSKEWRDRPFIVPTEWVS